VPAARSRRYPAVARRAIRVRRVLSRCSVWVCAIMLLCLGMSGCAAWDEPVAAAQTARQEAQARSSQPNAARETITVEFDATEEVMKKGADGQFFVRAFQVGFFDGPILVRALEIQRERAAIAATRVTLVVPIVSLSRGPAMTVEVRVRGLTSGPLGQWSAPAGLVKLASEAPSSAARRARNRPAGTGANRVRSSLNPAQLERHPALKSALEPLLDGGLRMGDVMSSFSRVQDLAAAVVIVRQRDVPLARLCAALKEDRTRSLTEALRSLGVPFDARRAVAAARPEARKLLAAAPPSR